MGKHLPLVDDLQEMITRVCRLGKVLAVSCAFQISLKAETGGW
jgi:hypothetical protein